MSSQHLFAYFTIWLVAGLFSMSLAVALAHIKRRTWVLWGVVCLFLPPLVVLLFFLPRRAGPAPYEKESDSWFDSQGRDHMGWWN